MSTISNSGTKDPEKIGNVLVYHAEDGWTGSERATREEEEQPHLLRSRDFKTLEMTDGRLKLEEYRPRAPNMDTRTGWHVHDVELQILYLMRGTMDVEFEDGVAHLTAGSVMNIPGNTPHNLVFYTPDTVMMELSVPAKFETRHVDPPKKKKT